MPDHRDPVTPYDIFKRYDWRLMFAGVVTSGAINYLMDGDSIILIIGIGVTSAALWIFAIPAITAHEMNRRMKRNEDPVRPRFGALHRRNGDTILLVFHPTADPHLFRGFHAATEEIVTAYPGDQLAVDVLGPGQGVELAVDPRE